MDDVLLYSGVAVLLTALIAIRIANGPGRRASARTMEWVLGVSGAGALSVLASGIISSGPLGTRIVTIAAGSFCVLVILGAILLGSIKSTKPGPDNPGSKDQQ